MRPEDLRREYGTGDLSEHGAPDDPLALFREWLTQAVGRGLPEPNAATLATASADGRPSARIVLLKGIEDGAFLFATNYESRKGRELAANPWAGLVFHWQPQERQVRLEGRAVPAPAAVSDRIFAARPRPAQIGTWTIRQSAVVGDRAELERRFAEAERRFPGPVPRPTWWGAYGLVPQSIEFWQGRPHRLHDRLCYTRLDDGTWRRERLAP
jgi:pyridoxamine 5'-phosphate oxidase